MIGRTALVLLAASAVACVSSGSAAESEQLMIRPGVGIGPINLGMSGAQVRSALGRPRVVVTRRVVGGRPYTELEWGLGRWNIGFVGERGRRRVVLVGTGLGRHRTPEGIGIDSTRDQVWRALRGVRERTCRRGPLQWVLSQGRTETIFFVSWYAPIVNGVEVRAAPTLGCGF